MDGVGRPGADPSIIYEAGVSYLRWRTPSPGTESSRSQSPQTASLKGAAEVKAAESLSKLLIQAPRWGENSPMFG